MGDEGAPLYTNVELLELYDLVATAIVTSVFGESRAEGVTLPQAIERLERMARSPGQARHRRTLKAILDTVGDLAHELKLYKRGVQGERQLDQLLGLLDIPAVQTGPLRLRDGTYATEIDNVLITDHCVFILECKYMKTAYTIDPHGLLLDYNRRHPYDISYSLMVRESVLRHVVAQAGVANARYLPIHPCLVLINRAAKVRDHCANVPCFLPGELLAHVKAATTAHAGSILIDKDRLASLIRDRSSRGGVAPSVPIGDLYASLSQVLPAMPTDCWRAVFEYEPAKAST